VLHERVFIELSGGFGVPLVRDRFFLDPNDTTAFRVPWVAGLAGGALGFTIF